MPPVHASSPSMARSKFDHVWTARVHVGGCDSRDSHHVASIPRRSTRLSGRLVRSTDPYPALASRSIPAPEASSRSAYRTMYQQGTSSATGILVFARLELDPRRLPPRRALPPTHQFYRCASLLLHSFDSAASNKMFPDFLQQHSGIPRISSGTRCYSASAVPCSRPSVPQNAIMPLLLPPYESGARTDGENTDGSFRITVRPGRDICALASS
jgi:hypothetical protein